MVEKLPDNWVEITLGQITTKPQYGWTSKSAKEGDIKYLRTTDLSKGSVDWESVPYCLKIPDKISKYELNDNDILISRAGSVGLSFRITKPPKNAVFASYLIRFKAIKNNAKFIEYYLKSPLYWNSISTISAGIAVQNINATKLSNLKLPLPPLAEQERIVAKLDDLFLRLDKIKTSLKKIPVLLKNFRQQVLTQAVTGKLIGKFKFSPLGDLGIKIKTGPFGSALHKSEYIENGIPVINPSHIKNGIIIPDKKVTISKTKAKELNRWILEPNDIILGRRGEMGRCALYIEGSDKMICGTGSLVLKCGSELSPTFLDHYLRSAFCINYLENNSVGSTMINLNQKIIKSLPFPNMSLKVQEKSIRHLDFLFSKADSIQEKYENLKAKIEQLPQTILHKAFKGELVPQLESDGDAKELLREIEELKKSAGSKPKKGNTRKYKIKEEELLEAAEGKANYKTQ